MKPNHTLSPLNMQELLEQYPFRIPLMYVSFACFNRLQYVQPFYVVLN